MSRTRDLAIEFFGDAGFEMTDADVYQKLTQSILEKCVVKEPAHISMPLAVLSIANERLAPSAIASAVDDYSSLAAGQAGYKIGCQLQLEDAGSSTEDRYKNLNVLADMYGVLNPNQAVSE